MKNFTDLNLGFTNAENYRRRANKELLAKYFVRDSYLEKLLDPNVYFLVGEKGTGKTAYSTYLRNNKYRGKNAFAYDVRQTEYQKFLELKRMGHLPLSQYSGGMAYSPSHLGGNQYPGNIRDSGIPPSVYKTRLSQEGH